jgi:hypothetical protein
MPRPAVLLLLLTGLTAVASCTRVQARMPPPAPPVALETPVPPPPLIIPVDDPPERPADPPPPAAPASTSGDNRTTGPPRSTAMPPPPAPPPPAPDPPSVLRPSVNVAQLVAETNHLLENAERDLAAAGTRPLSRDAREQHRTAIRFVGMARDALKVRNYYAALASAKKAAAMAGLLVRGEPLPTAP